MNRFVAAIVLLFSLNAVAAPEDDIRSSLQLLDPNIPILSIESERLPGFYAVTLATGEILYVSEDRRFILSGQLYQLPEQGGVVNLTEHRLKQYRLNALASVEDKDLVIYPAEGEPKARLKVFTDVDCPYCRKLHAEVPTLNRMGVEVAYLAFPRSGPGTPTAEKMEAIWCLEGVERLKAMDRSKSGQENSPQSCNSAVNDQFVLGQQLGVTGTPTIIFEDGSVVPGYVPAERLKQMLGL